MLLKLRTDLRNKLSLIRLFLINADSFLNENLVSYSVQNLSPSNGRGVRALKRLGVDTVAFSTKRSEALLPIIDRLGVEILHQGITQKSALFSTLKVQHSVQDKEIALFSGDSSDLPMIERVNFPVAPADAPLEVKAKSYYVTYGVREEAVSEVAELILRARNHSGNSHE
jgi:3-deoxy-D-manno-octulosonate 8-phosphate phosphatase (KDO 8-P phosphatase)